jgi:phospholipase/carboxylesterase
MNRIEIPAKSSAASSSMNFSLEAGRFEAASAETACALFGPLEYEAKYAYPLIVWLHDRGEDESQLLRIMPMVSIRNYVAVSPRGLLLPGDDGRDCYGWPQSGQQEQVAEDRIHESIDVALRKYHVGRDRIFLAGFGAGATMAFRAAMNSPERFAGVISLCGPLPRGNHPFSQFEQIRRLSILLAVARDSAYYPPERACDDLRLFHTAGLSIILRQYACGQQLTSQMLRDVDRWIIEEITSDAAKSADRFGEGSPSRS